MLFGTATFLFLFLPLVLAAHWLTPERGKNALLLAASLVFYAWSGLRFVPLLVAVIVVNWLLGRALSLSTGARRRAWLAAGITLNLVPLLAFKYAGISSTLPVGISFYAFHAISYLVDIHRAQATPFRSPADMGLYLAFFPHLIAGPIIRSWQIAGQIRGHRTPEFARGCERFTIGLARKLLIADQLAVPASYVFSLPGGALTAQAAWFGLACYTLQIYFDFSGYSDMAIGLAAMFGFTFPENFRAPYAALGMRDFWRRWHITLSSWFRDYLYLPLGGNRVSRARVAVNLVSVFLLCGIWHGAALTFVAWGLFHGLFLVLERGPWGSLLERTWAPAVRAYSLAVAAAGWVLFRSPDLAFAAKYYSALLGMGSQNPYAGGIALRFTAHTLLALGAGTLLVAGEWLSPEPGVTRIQSLLPAPPRAAWNLALLLLCAVSVSVSTSHPFLYFQF